MCCIFIDVFINIFSAAPALMVEPVWMVLTPLRVYAQRDSLVTTASMISMSVTPNLA